MKRFLAAVLCLVGSCVACAPARYARPIVGTPNDLVEKTVALVESGRAYCSGVWVGKDAILTANHCVADLEINDELTFATADDLAVGASVGGEAVRVVRIANLGARDERHDLALLRVYLVPQHEIAQVDAQPLQGEFAQTMGHSLGLWWSFSAGTVSAIRLIDFGDGPTYWVQSNAAISPGNSGGGLFDQSGRLIGLCHAYMPRGENVNLYVHPRHVADFLAREGV